MGSQASSKMPCWGLSMNPLSSHVEKQKRTEKEAEGGETTGR